MTKEYQKVKITDIKPYENNPRLNDSAVDAVKKSISQCGYIAPIVVDENMVVLAGHTRLKALTQLKRDTVDVLVVSGLTDDQKRKYRLLDNKTDELADWNFDALAEELEGLDFDDLDLDWFDTFDISDEINNAKKNGEGAEGYDDFVDKFKPKLTTDDCFTPPLVYDAVKDWAVKEYGWEGRPIVRPFYPGGDYEHEKYPKNCVVIDNPPFSLSSKITRFYNEHGIDFFLFAPTLTAFSNNNNRYVMTGVPVIYDNGASVNTSFVCSQGPKIRSAPDLYNVVSEAVEQSKDVVHVPNYSYPVNVITSSMIGQFSKYGVEYQEDNAIRVGALDEQKKSGKAIYGDGFIVPTENIQLKQEQLKQERLKQEYVWHLSDREKEIVRQLDEKAGETNGENGTPTD